MTDIVEQLRDPIANYDRLRAEAADEIERLRAQANAEIIKLNDALWEKQQEIERLRRNCEVATQNFDNLALEHTKLTAEIARLRADNLRLAECETETWKAMKAEIERLRAANADLLVGEAR